MKKYSLLIALLIILTLILVSGTIPPTERIITIHHYSLIETIKEVEKPVEVTKEVEKRVYIFNEKKEYIYVGANATEEELARVYKDIAYGRYSHQYAVNNPQLQNIYTGDTAWNLYWVDSYDLFKTLIDRAYKLP